MLKERSSTLKLKRLHIDTQFEHIIYMLKDCAVYKSEGLESLSRVQVHINNRTLIASLNIIDNGILQHGEAGLSEGAWKILHAEEGAEVYISHLRPSESMKYVRTKMYGNKLTLENFKEILSDIISGGYSNVEISAFITACAGDKLDVDEITSLTKAMMETGQKLTWNKDIVVDKHCVGGLPGNRTTPIVVAIVAAAGLTIPKTSSRAITSPAGTADVLETMTLVNLNPVQITDVVSREGGCFTWGGSAKLSPADDIIIRIERALDLDSEGQMIASVLSKKSAAGSTHVVIDLPVGKTAKVRTLKNAEKLKYYFKVVAANMNLKVKVIITDGSQPVGRGIGPALEAMDVLSVLRNEDEAPMDLRERSVMLAGQILELAGKAKQGQGNKMALEILNTGSAYEKFIAVCNAQGGFKEPQPSKQRVAITADKDGVIKEIDNRKLAKVAKLAGAPRELSAGVLFLSPLGKKVNKGDVLYYIYAKEPGALNYALEYLATQKDIIVID